MPKPVYQLPLSCGLTLWAIFSPGISQAQVISDNTLLTSVSSSDQLSFTIQGGTSIGTNLFHSFQNFSIPSGGSAIFEQDAAIQTIFSRVTGSQISDIQGLMQSNGNASLVLLNPNGITFGPDATLQVGGSFLATTAETIAFADGSLFSARNLQASPLLTISQPSGLQFGNNPGEILSQAAGSAEAGGLQVPLHQTLALIGGNVRIEGGFLFAPSGSIALGSVAGNSFVDLTPDSQGWQVSYAKVQNFQDIDLQQNALNIPTVLSTSDLLNFENSSGPITLQGRQIRMTGFSDQQPMEVIAFNFGPEPGGEILLKASDSVTLDAANISSFNAPFFSTGASGNITIQTNQLTLRNQSFINASSQNDGAGGNITIEAAQSVEIDGGGFVSRIATDARNGGNAGNLTLTTGDLRLRNGGQISTSTQTFIQFLPVSQSGAAGSIQIQAQQVSIAGQGQSFSLNAQKRPLTTVQPSGIFAQTIGGQTNGNGGNISLVTNTLSIDAGGSISVASLQGSQGQAGFLSILAPGSVEMSGSESRISAKSESSLPAGDLTIRTGNLTVKQRASITVSSEGTGTAGDLVIEAKRILLEDAGSLAANTRGGKGDILLLADFVGLLRNGTITTDATQAASGGDITISTQVLALLKISDITANAVQGRGGNINIQTTGLFLDASSRITASSEFGLDGVVQITNPEGDLAAGLTDLGAGVVDPATLVSTICAGTKRRPLGELVLVGRGGIPTEPQDITHILPSPVAMTLNTWQPLPTPPAQVLEAQGWYRNAQDEMVLTSHALTPPVGVPLGLPRFSCAT
jgi:filamentous hemagglutinin family protein